MDLQKLLPVLLSCWIKGWIWNSLSLFSKNSDKILYFSNRTLTWRLKDLLLFKMFYNTLFTFILLIFFFFWLIALRDYNNWSKREINLLSVCIFLTWIVSCWWRKTIWRQPTISNPYKALVVILNLVTHDSTFIMSSNRQITCIFPLACHVARPTFDAIKMRT